MTESGVVEMSTSERTLPTTKPQPWIPRLVVGNVVALIGALLTSFASGSMSPWLTSWRAIFFGLVFGQASLLGIWGALGQNPWWVRLMGVSPVRLPPPSGTGSMAVSEFPESEGSAYDVR